jgi:Flp pilus assembly protein protease CpaA
MEYNLLSFFLILYVLINSISDLIYKKIYNLSNLIFFFLIFIVFLINKDPILNHFLGMGLIFFICLPLYIFKILSGGDLKMLSVLGFFHGYPESLEMLICAVFLSALFSLLFITFKGDLKILFKRFYLFFVSIFNPSLKFNLPKVKDSIYVPIGIAIGISSIIVYTKLTKGFLI